MSFAAIATLGIALATILLGFLGYRAMTFRGNDETSTSNPRQL